MKRGEALERRTPLERGEPLRATKWGTRPAAKKASWRDEFMPERMAPDAPKYTPYELAWFAFVRSLPCACGHLGGCWGPMQAAHVALTANEKGTALKVPHAQTVPLCYWHHGLFDGNFKRTGGNPFDGMTREERYEMAGAWLEVVYEAATPGDDRDHADELERLGLGTVVGDGAGGWKWWPGTREVEPEALAGAVP